MWRDDIRDVNIVDATKEGRSNDHQYKHESIKRSNIIICSLEKKKILVFSLVNKSRLYRIMSSIIFPMEICRVPRDSWAGSMYASRVKLNMLVTANSTSAISWGSS